MTSKCHIQPHRCMRRPFLVRCCWDCLTGATISAYTLEHDYGVPPDRLTDLPKYSKPMRKFGCACRNQPQICQGICFSFFEKFVLVDSHLSNPYIVYWPPGLASMSQGMRSSALPACAGSASSQ